MLSLNTFILLLSGRWSRFVGAVQVGGTFIRWVITAYRVMTNQTDSTHLMSLSIHKARDKTEKNEARAAVSSTLSEGKWEFSLKAKHIHFHLPNWVQLWLKIVFFGLCLHSPPGPCPWTNLSGCVVCRPWMQTAPRRGKGSKARLQHMHLKSLTADHQNHSYTFFPLCTRCLYRSCLYNVLLQ